MRGLLGLAGLGLREPLHVYIHWGQVRFMQMASCAIGQVEIR